MCSGNSKYGSEQYTQEFIRNVNTVLQQHKGNFVGHFEVRFELNRELAIHLDNWVGFVVASKAQNLAFDLVPAEFRGRNDRYLLPSKLLDSASTSCLQNVQLGFVPFKLPSLFSGFPNLRKLDLQFVMSQQGILKICCQVAQVLRGVTGIKSNAMKLKTFGCRGSRYPIDLTQSLELKDAHLYFFDSVTLEYTLSTLPTVLPSVQCLYLRATATLKISVCSFAHLGWEPLRSLPRCPHNHLKNLHITGFTACTGQLEFLLHAVEMALRWRLTLDPAFRSGKEVGGGYGGPTDVFFSRVREISRRNLIGRISPNTKLCIL